MIYSTDESGIYNIYVEDQGNGGYVTNILGGAFMPSISNDGSRLLFSLYEKGRYNIAIKDFSSSICSDMS